MPCPNFLVCGEETSNFNGVCYICDSSKYGYFSKYNELIHGLHPSVKSEPENYSDYKPIKLDIEHRDQLLEELNQKRLTTGVLTIENRNDNCPICLSTKNIFVKHPTCNIHSVCNSCFKNTFLDGNIEEYTLPTEPECYRIFQDFMDNNNIIEKEDKNFRMHIDDTYNCYCNFPNDNWPENIKQIYTQCSDYDRKYYEYNLWYENKIKKNVNIRQCPICRASDITL